MTICGDVESNPGLVPLLPDDVLTNLAKMNLDTVMPIESGLNNKHVWQLHQHREKTRSTWDDVVKWLKVLISEFPTDDANWSRNTAANGKLLLGFRRRLQSSKSRGQQQKEAFLNWEEELYSSPTVLSPRTSKPSLD